jgi:hypothetical protein
MELWKWFLVQSVTVFSLFLGLGLALLAAWIASSRRRHAHLPD